MSIEAKNWRIVTLITLSILFLFIYSWLPFKSSTDGDFKFASPDGTANYFWTVNYATKTELTYFEELNLFVNDIVVPRSVMSENGTVRPVSFLGIILIYGAIAKIFGIWIIKYLTPIFAVFGALCFFGIIRKIFDNKTAWMSFLMFLVLAPYWYYTSRSMFHNVLMVDLVLIGLLFLVYSTRIEQIKRINTNLIYIFFGGIFIGLAVITRVSELIWILPLVFLTWVFYIKKIKLDKILIFVCGVIIALMPMFYYNQILYGDFLKFGYSKPAVETQNFVSNIHKDTATLSSTETQDIVSLRKKINKILPFGFYPRQIAKSFVYYFIVMFWYLFWPAFLGALLFLYKYKEKSKAQKLYFWNFIIISFILVIFYGSWSISDNIRPNAVTIGNSYTRYWLPMYIMSLPFVVTFFQWIVSLLSLLLSYCHSGRSEAKIRNPEKNNWKFEYIIISLFIITFFILNIKTAVYGKDEGLIYTLSGIKNNKQNIAQILTLVEDDAIIITKHLDKFFFPNRKVIAGDLNDDFKNEQYQKLINLNIPLCYYGFIYRSQDLEFLNDAKFKDLNLKIEEIELNEEVKLGLYKIKDAKLK